MTESIPTGAAVRRRYRAFISYSHRDTAWAEWLHRSLERYHPPKALVGQVTARGAVPSRLSPVFRDRDELATATDLGTLLLAALENSDCQIVLCSPAAAASKWVNEEILAFKRLGREDRIFCLIVGGEPYAANLPGREHEECFPPALKYRLAADGKLGTVATEPIAADARPGKDGRNDAKLKLIAGILGVDFDALKRREQQRRNRQLLVVAAAALTGMLFTSALASYALIKRNEAREQARRAESETQVARETARFLVDLFRISDPGEARGNSVTAREMLDKGAARVEHDLARAPAIQATVMDTLGTVYTGLGLYARARPMLDRAAAARRRLAGANSLELSDTLSHQGELLKRQGDYAAAEQAYREALKLQSGGGETPSDRARYAATLYGLGVLLSERGNYPEAQRTLREALQLQQAPDGDEPAEIARTLKDLARATEEGGDLKAAIPLMEKSVAMQRELRGREPHPDLAEALNDLAGLYQQAEAYSRAEKMFEESLAMKRRLLGDQHPEIAAGLENLASVLQDMGEPTRAEDLYQQSLAIRRQVLGPEHSEVAITLHNLASLQYDRRQLAMALANEQEALRIFRIAFAGDHPYTANTLNTLGTWLTFQRDYDAADRDLSEALAMRTRLFDAENPAIASSLAAQAILRVAQGRYEQALASSRRAVEIDTRAYAADHWRTAIAEAAEGAALAGLGQYAEAGKLLDHSHAILSHDGGAPAAFSALAQHYRDALRQRRSPAAPRSG